MSSKIFINYFARSFNILSGNGVCESSTIRAKLSSGALSVTVCFSHKEHLWTILHFLFFCLTPTGSISPWHSEALSPGTLSSKCLLHKQCGQWLLYLPPLTVSPQLPQIYFSFFGTIKLVRLLESESLELLCFFSKCVQSPSLPAGRQGYNLKKPRDLIGELFS